MLWVPGLEQPAVEGLHELRGRAILNVPMVARSELRPRAQEAADEPEVLVPLDDDARAGRARARRDQSHGELELIEVVVSFSRSSSRW